MTELPPLPAGTHGECPRCSENLDGDGIWLTFYHRYLREESGDAAKAMERADEMVENYGATRTKGRWGLAIGIVENDRCSKHACPACGAIWDGHGRLTDEEFDMDSYQAKEKNLYV